MNQVIKLSEARNIIGHAVKTGQISLNEASRRQNNLSRIQASAVGHATKQRQYRIWVDDLS